MSAETAPRAAALAAEPNGSPSCLEAESLWQNPLAHELRGPGQWSVEERNVWLDHALDDDPSRPLPQVHLGQGEAWTPDTDKSHVETTSFRVDSPDGKYVGYVLVSRPIESAFYGSDKYFIRVAKIFDDERGHGYGPAMYLSVLKSLPAGAGLRTEGVLSDDAKRVWEGMVAKGVARPSDKGGTPTAFETVF